MIGVFDSGYGGLTIINQLIQELPEYNYVYLGDNVNAPYGNKSEETIYNYTCAGVDFLFKKGCRLVILACNTASAKALKRIQQEYLPKKYSERRVLGVIIPTVETVLETIKKKKKTQKRIGIIGTRMTIESMVYNKKFKKIDKNLEIISKSCPLLVPLVEKGWAKKYETKMILRKYLGHLKLKKINYLILGCTHYPFLLSEIRQIIGKNVFIINTSEAVAKKTKEYLQKHNELEIKLFKNKKQLYLTTGSVKEFRRFCNQFYGKNIDINKISLKLKNLFE